MQSEQIEIIAEFISPRVSRMELGEISDCEGLFDLLLWNDVPASERRHVFGRPISMLVAQGKLPLEFVGFDSKRHNLYRKK